jgi:hypothetical protein
MKRGPKPAAEEYDWPSHDRAKSVPLLQALHILTRDGKLNADSRRKLKQVLHLTQLLRPSLERLLEQTEEPLLADLGAGKSYLGFILYDLVFGPAGRGRVIGVEVRDELIEQSRKLAVQSDFERMDFMASAIGQASLPGKHADMVTALHACDTATDDAIRLPCGTTQKSLRSFPVARRKWRGCSRARRGHCGSSGGIRSSGGNSARISPT